MLDDDVEFENELFGSNHNFNFSVNAENPENETNQIQSSSLLTVEHSDSIMDIHSKNLFLMTFPDLFPFGRGGFDEPRKTKMSFLVWVRYLLRTSRFKFVQHPTFCLIAFDVQNRKNLSNTQCIKCSLNPHLSEQIGSISDEELKAFLAFEKHKYNARRLGMTVRDLPPSLSGTFVRSVEKILQHGWFSDNERVYYRTRLFSMSNQLGSPHIFFTLSPDAPNRLLVKYYAGVLSDEEYLTTITTPSSYHLNAPASALYFDEQIQFFILNVLKFDSKAGVPLGNGVFGITRAFFGAVESQSTTNLHIHMLIWVEELPKSRKSWVQNLESQEFVTFLCDYADRIKCCSYPFEPAPMCPKCFADIEPLPLSDHLKKKDKTRLDPPHTLKCSICPETFPYNYFRNHIEKRHVVGTESVVPLDSTGPLMQVQEHDYNHRKSCFKKSVRTTDINQCRFQMPIAPHPGPTEFVDGQLILQRNLGCEYLNGYNPILARVFPGDNHDVQLLVGGTATKEVSFYTMKYATKKQQKIENLQNFIYHEWIEKRKKELQRNVTATMTRNQIGYGRLSSMVYQLSKYNEVPATVASLYLLRESGFYISHSFVTLSLFESIHLSQGEQSQANIVRQSPSEENDEPQFAIIKVLDDYLYRPNSLDHMCWFEVTKCYSRQKGTTNSQDALLFKDNHPLSKSHILVKNNSNTIVNLLSRRLPKSSSTNPQDLEYFYLSCLLLFKPFTDMQTIQEWKSNLAENYTTFIQSAPQWILDYIDNNDDYWSQVEIQNQHTNAVPQTENLHTQDENDERDMEDFNEFDYIDTNDEIPDSSLETDELPIQFHFRAATDISSSLTNLPKMSKKHYVYPIKYTILN
jgi:hypothetical protein